MKFLREYIRESLRDTAEMPAVLYHATYGPLVDSIQQRGLGGQVEWRAWDFSEPGTVYLSPDHYDAHAYAETSDDAWEKFETDEGLDIVVLEVDTSQLDPSRLGIDRNNQDESTLEYHGVIPPSALKIFSREFS